MPQTSRPLIQDLVKESMARSSSRLIASEGARQLKVAEASPAEVPAGDESVSTAFAEKLAAAIEFVAPHLVKAASEVGPGKGPNTLPISESRGGEQGATPGGQGKGHAQPPMNPGTQSARPNDPSTQMENDDARAPGGPGKQTAALDAAKTASALEEKNRATLAKLAGSLPPWLAKKDGDKAEDKDADKGDKSEKKQDEKKEASASDALVDAFLDTVKEARSKVAADENNPAHISAGKAVAPDTSAAGEAGGAPVGGMPQGPRALVHSNEGAASYKKNQAYAGRKTELAQYFKEPALTSATDTTLQQAFAHTGEAGTKLASSTVRSAAARALLQKIAEKQAGTKCAEHGDEPCECTDKKSAGKAS